MFSNFLFTGIIHLFPIFIFCCFLQQVENDIVDYMRYKILTGQDVFGRMALKPGVLPHIFDCQSDRLQPAHTQAEKREHKFIKQKELLKRRKILEDLAQTGPSSSVSVFLLNLLFEKVVWCFIVIISCRCLPCNI
uniref:Uncharacterized protein n=1 Tax=Cacopsylla melanoneura TaxID=428564 RepID=A0A8D8U049_9HEMI